MGQIWYVIPNNIEMVWKSQPCQRPDSKMQGACEKNIYWRNDNIISFNELILLKLCYLNNALIAPYCVFCKYRLL